MTSQDKVRFVQIVGHVLIEDGVLSDHERSYLDRLMDELKMDEDLQQEAFRGISLDAPVEERVAGLPKPVRGGLRKSAEAVVGEDPDGDQKNLLLRLDALFSE